MIKSKNIKNWINCWKPPKEEKENWMADLGSVDLWNKRADGFATILSPKKKQQRTSEIFALLDRAGFKAKGAQVLDIGSGPGAIAIPLARAGAKVTALDISYKALEHLKANADREGLHIDAVECSWWDANVAKLGLRNKFDLVVTSMTPALKDAEAFVRMMSCSREFCYYSHFLQFDHPGNLDENLQRILKQKAPGKRSGGISPFMNYFMYVYLQGYRPLVGIQHKKSKSEMPWEKAGARAVKSVEFSGRCSAVAKKKIYSYYRDSAVNGKCRIESDGYTGMMVWNVNQKAVA